MALYDQLTIFGGNAHPALTRAICENIGIPPGQIDLALAKASPEPKTLDDAKLWEDWLRFLQGAAENGGLVVQ